MVTNQIREEFHDFDKFLSLKASFPHLYALHSVSKTKVKLFPHFASTQFDYLLNNIAKKLRSKGAAFFTEEKNLRGNIVISHERPKFAPK